MSCSKKYRAKRYYIEKMVTKSDFDKYLDYKESKKKIIDYGTKKKRYDKPTNENSTVQKCGA